MFIWFKWNWHNDTQDIGMLPAMVKVLNWHLQSFFLQVVCQHKFQKEIVILSNSKISVIKWGKFFYSKTFAAWWPAGHKLKTPKLKPYLYTNVWLINIPAGKRKIPIRFYSEICLALILIAYKNNSIFFSIKVKY